MSQSGPRHYGKYRATVLNNQDPQFQGRLQVQLSEQYGLFISTWVLPCFPRAGKGGASLVAMPAIGDAVWVEFEAGDPNCPIWSGGFWSDIGGFPTSALIGATPVTPNLHLQTTTGVSVTLSDLPASQVQIRTPAGAMLTIGAQGITISNGQGASIQMSGPSVIINGGALVVT
ncbi:phage baseplate assembly protein V [Pseudogemmobacter bohemicus]|uniref:phage baseplate assembly protein V n=1 Tax=Pseudogemmobacter bohemicus TaxID=2250708 RepID=UPI000DD49E7C|nr:phage baseplate assembly protein V [Pseudogemmobacter bohemicus]